LDGKTVVITGGAGGIGAATCRRLAAEGAAVVVSDLDLAGAEAVAKEIAAAGGQAAPFQADVSSESDWDHLIGFAVAEFGGLWGLNNNAADLSMENMGRDTTLLDLPLEVWHHTLAVTLTGAFYGARRAIPEMLKGGGGVIVNTTSDTAFNPELFGLSYAAAKGGVLPLTRHVARVYGKQGIRCNAVSPGLITTDGARAVLAAGGFDVDAHLAGTPTPRFGEPRDVAAMIALLMSDDGEFVTGQTWCVNGGLNMR
jgi:NAD(P)-dependent dehydrogenase (short-subunit alcohol dehydrogenase family)